METIKQCKQQVETVFCLPFKMSSIIKLEKFKGDGTQDVKACLQSFTQWAKFHDLPDSKVNAFPFYLEGHAKVWYEN